MKRALAGNKIFYLFICSFIIFIFNLSLAQTVLAQAASGLGVTPPLNDLAAKPGEEFGASIKLTNNDEQQKILHPVILCFLPDNKTGTPQFQTVGNDQPYCLKRHWLDFPETTVILPAKETKEYNFTFKLDVDTAPGTYYGAIAFEEQPELAMIDDPAKVVVNSQIASLFLLKVAGEQRETGEISGFSVGKKWHLVRQEEVVFTSGFKNTGNAHYKPSGQITIYNSRNEQISTLPVNQGKDAGFVLPDSQRQWQTVWGDKPLIGKYSADVTFTFGADKIVKSQPVEFYIIPAKEIGTYGGGGVAGAAVLFFGFKFYNRRLILRYRKRNEKK